MALAERLPNDTSMFLKNTRNRVNKNVPYKAAVNDGDDGDDNDDEDSLNMNLNDGKSFFFLWCKLFHCY